MRIYINDNETDFEKLAANVASSPRAAAAVRARLETLNPQFSKRVPKGAALVLPDGPDIKASAGTTVRGANLDELAERFKAGTREAAKRAGTRLEELTAERTAVRDALKTAAAKRLIGSDPLLQKRLQAAEASFKTEQKRGAEYQARLAEHTKIALAEFARLRKAHG